jgi:arginyl-tRNA synthetase
MLTQILAEKAKKAIGALYGEAAAATDLQINQTKPEFEGDYTLVLFGLVKQLKKSPEALGQEIGARMMEDDPAFFSGMNVIKGFLNLGVTDTYWYNFLQRNYHDICYGKKALNDRKVMVEYSSPNTNKPLHLGHLRNIFLGWSIAEIYKANGYTVYKSCIVNDRGIHICKSMLAWQRFGNGETPQSSGMKGDHLVGKYYVLFNDAYKKEVDELMAGGMTKELAEKQAPILLATQDMLRGWENGDAEIMQLWRTMNGWVYEGFDQTYKRIGADFDKIYYESNTYLLGKETVQKGLASGVFFRKDDSSVWIDLTDEGLDQKLVLRKDGTSVYITQDLGLAQQKYEQYGIDESIYVIGNEQDYHMQVLKLICKKFGLPYADSIYHLSYGMVELPSGKMKSREGTVVDADDLVDEMIAEVKKEGQERDSEKADSELKRMDTNDKEILYNTLALGAMKFYLLRVEPKKKMVFNPSESIDLLGFTGPYIQYAHTRIQAILRKAGNATGQPIQNPEPLTKLEKDLALTLEQYGATIEEACRDKSPSVIANYIYHLARSFNSFYADSDHKVKDAATETKKELRLQLVQMTGLVIKSGMQLLGIRVPDKM